MAKTLLSKAIMRLFDARPSPPKGNKTHVKIVRKDFADTIAQEAGGDIRTAWNLVQLAGSLEYVSGSQAPHGTKRRSDGSEASSPRLSKPREDPRRQHFQWVVPCSPCRMKVL